MSPSTVWRANVPRGRQPNSSTDRLMLRNRTVAVICCSLMLAACTDGRPIADPVVVGAPVLVSANSVVGAAVGMPVAYDATQRGSTFSDPTGGGLRYALTLSGPANGLTAAGGIVGGRPTAPGVVVATLTATDSQGATVADRFPIVVFAAGLRASSVADRSGAHAPGQRLSSRDRHRGTGRDDLIHEPG